MSDPFQEAARVAAPWTRRETRLFQFLDERDLMRDFLLWIWRESVCQSPPDPSKAPMTPSEYSIRAEYEALRELEDAERGLDVWNDIPDNPIDPEELMDKRDRALAKLNALRGKEGR